MRFDFDIAGPRDDAAIRHLLAENPMPGMVSAAFEREPDYFAGHGVMGDRCVTLKALRRDTGKLAGIMCMAAASRYIKGAVKPVGYIGQIRLDREFRGMMLPLRAMPFIRQQARNGWPDLWFGAVVDDNPTARALFVDLPRTTFPVPEEISRVHTLALLTRPIREIAVERGDALGWNALVDFLNNQGARREFFPFIENEHFTGESRTPGLKLEDFLVLVEKGEIAGVCAVWDQSEFKQTVVHGYSGWLGRMRPLINSAGRLAGMKKLPGVGEAIPSASLSFVVVRNDDPVVLRRLMEAAIGEAHRRGKDYLMAGFCVRDPLLAAAKEFRHIRYRSTMYAFGFDGTLPEETFDRNRVPYVEVSTL